MSEPTPPTPPAYPRLEEKLELFLRKSAKHYLRHGVFHLLEPDSAEDDTIQALLNLQAAIECLSTLHALKAEGWTAITVKKMHAESENALLELLDEGKLRTLRFDESKKHVIDTMEFSDLDETLLNELQGKRNVLSHLGLPTLSPSYRDDLVKATVRLVFLLAWRDFAGTYQGLLQNHAEELLGNELFSRLRTEPIYITEVERVADERCSDGVKRCPECRVLAWACGNLPESGEDMMCFSCGFKIAGDMLSFTDCPFCKAGKAMYYDACNCDENNPVGGRCTECTERAEIVICQLCGASSLNEPNWQCECEKAA